MGVQWDQQMMKRDQRGKRKPENYIVTEGKEERISIFSKAAERSRKKKFRKSLLEFSSFSLIGRFYDVIMKNNSS